MADGEGKSRSFAWLNVTQFFGALNDNVFQMLVILFLFYFFKADDAKQAEILFVGMVVFVVPFLLFSHAAGVLSPALTMRRWTCPRSSYTSSAKRTLWWTAITAFRWRAKRASLLSTPR